MTDQEALKALLLLVEEKRTQLSRSYAGNPPAAVVEKINHYAKLRQWVEKKAIEVQDAQGAMNDQG